jgi:integrase
MDEILAAARWRAGLDHATCHELRHTIDAQTLAVSAR